MNMKKIHLTDHILNTLNKTPLFVVFFEENHSFSKKSKEKI